MELNIPEIVKLIESVEELKKIISSSDSLTQEWYDLDTACKLKGVNKNTLYFFPHSLQKGMGYSCNRLFSNTF